MNKKGVERQTLYAFYIFFVILICVLTYSFVKNTTDKVDYRYLTKDVGLLIETVYASPGEIEVNYKMPKKSIVDFYINENQVILVQKDTAKDSSYTYLLPFDIENQELKSIINLKISKKAGGVFVS